MSLAAEPNIFASRASGGKATHQLINGGPEKVIFRIISTNSEHYQITPMVGFVPGNSQLAVEIVRLDGPAKQDKLTIEFAPSKGDAKDAKLAWNYTTPTANITVPLNAS